MSLKPKYLYTWKKKSFLGEKKSKQNNLHVVLTPTDHCKCHRLVFLIGNIHKLSCINVWVLYCKVKSLYASSRACVGLFNCDRTDMLLIPSPLSIHHLVRVLVSSTRVSVIAGCILVVEKSVTAATENCHSNSKSSHRPQPLNREQSLTQSNLL